MSIDYVHVQGSVDSLANYSLEQYKFIDTRKRFKLKLSQVKRTPLNSINESIDRKSVV